MLRRHAGHMLAKGAGVGRGSRLRGLGRGGRLGGLISYMKWLTTKLALTGRVAPCGVTVTRRLYLPDQPK